MTQAKQYDDTNTGIIGHNDFKTDAKHPDQKGRVNVGGVWYWLSGWNKTSGNRSFTSLALTIMTQGDVDKMMEKRAAKNAPQQAAQQQQAQPQQQQSAPATQNNEPQGEMPDFDSDIPF